MSPRFTIAGVVMPALLLALACGDDDSPVEVVNDPEPLATTPQEFIDLLETTYNEKDLDTYTALLHDDYIYHFLPDDPGHPEIHDTWGLADELIATENIFTGAITYDSIQVYGIDLEISLQAVVADTLGKMDGGRLDISYDLTTEVDLLLVTYDPTANDGSGIIYRVVFSGQDFALLSDPERENNLLLKMQVDRESITKNRPSPLATEEASWGEIKKVMRYARNQSVETRIRRMLEDEFVTAYAEMDTGAYAGTLADLYEFENYPGDPGSPGEGEIWDRDEELQIAGHMFGGWENQNHEQVQSISLTQRVLEFQPNLETLAGRPAAEDWFDVITELNLTVVTVDTSFAEGEGLVNYSLVGDQKYVVQPDPDVADHWIIRRQIDRDPNLFKTGATEEPGWGAIKSLFR